MPQYFCPKCGTTQGSFIKGFCQKCFLEDNTVLELPRCIETAFCKHCTKVRIKGKWVGQGEQSIKEIVLASTKTKQLANPKFSVSLEPKGDGTTIATVTAKGTIEGEELSVSAQSLLVPKQITCQNCTLLGANYYEAILQLRFEKSKPNDFEKILKEIEALASSLQKTDSLSKITGIEKVYGGYNIQLGSKRAAKKIIEHFERKHKAKTKSSFTLAGINASGKVKKRFTFLVKF